MDKTYLSIGHVCMDLKGDGYVLGGTASYASIIAKGLGYQPKILTSYGDDFLFESKLEDFEVINQHAKETSIFENTYNGGDRKQKLKSRASSIVAADSSDADFDASIIHFCPITDEVSFELIDQKNKKGITLATPQGWMRQWDEEGIVSYKPFDWSLLKEIDFVIISEEDVPDLANELDNILASIEKLIVTKGELGADIYISGEKFVYPAYPSSPIDPTGAGDTFATAFITRYYETKEIEASMIYANCFSSVCVEHEGTNFLAHLDEVQKREVYYKDHLLGFQP